MKISIKLSDNRSLEDRKIAPQLKCSVEMLSTFTIIKLEPGICLFLKTIEPVWFTGFFKFHISIK